MVHMVSCWCCCHCVCTLGFLGALQPMWDVKLVNDNLDNTYAALKEAVTSNCMQK